MFKAFDNRAPYAVLFHNPHDFLSSNSALIQ